MTLKKSGRATVVLPRLATIKEACAYGKMGKSKLYVKMKEGTIRAYKREDQTLIDLDSIDDFNRDQLKPWVPAHRR